MWGPVGVGELKLDEHGKGIGEGPGPDILVGAKLVGGPPPGAPGNGEGPPGPGVEDAFDGAGEPGKGTDGGPPDVGGPVKELGGVLNG